jgi:tryptophan halogenase
VRKDVARNLMKLPKHQAFVRQFCPAGKPADAAMPGPAPAASPVPSGVSLRLNPEPKIQTPALSNGQVAYVIDDFLAYPDETASLMAGMAPHFQRPAHHPYPGPLLALPDALQAELDAYFQQHLRPLLGTGQPLGMEARFSRVTQDGSTLDPRQRICHRDDSGLLPDQGISALVHYLFRDEQLGGTVFFRPLMSEAQTHQFRCDANALDGASFEAKYGLRAGYMTQSNRYFEVVGRVAARWNRAVFYDGTIFHSGDIQNFSAERFHAGTGRLTLNAFFKSKKLTT